MIGTNGNGLQPVVLTAPQGTAEASAIPPLSELLTADPDQFTAKYTDIAAVNLACARGLTNCDETAFPKHMELLNTIADAVRRQTEKNWRLFKLKPKQFNNSENIYRLYTMEHVFRVQFNVRYDPVVRETTERGKPWTTGDSSELFIHGILSSKRTGTCSSLPTFAIAVGRRLGYPLKLILVPNHTLYRWDDGKEIFNLQPTEAGGEVKADEYFHEWPRKWDEIDYQMNARTKVWLHSLTPNREVSKFLCNRAIMLRDIRRYAEAFKALEAAERFDKDNPAVADIWFSVDYVAAGGNVNALEHGDAPQVLGRMGLGVYSPPTVQSEFNISTNCLCASSVKDSFAVSSFDPPPVQPKRPPEQSWEASDFSLEQARLVQLINESNRNRSPQYPNGNPPTEPLLRQLTQLLLNRQTAMREGE